MAVLANEQDLPIIENWEDRDRSGMKHHFTGRDRPVWPAHLIDDYL